MLFPTDVIGRRRGWRFLPGSDRYPTIRLPHRWLRRQERPCLRKSAGCVSILPTSLNSWQTVVDASLLEKTETRDAIQTGTWQCVFRNSIPRCASRSRLGVLTSGFPPRQPIQSLRSSMAIKTMFGRGSWAISAFEVPMRIFQHWYVSK